MTNAPPRRWTGTAPNGNRYKIVIAPATHLVRSPHPYAWWNPLWPTRTLLARAARWRYLGSGRWWVVVLHLEEAHGLVVSRRVRTTSEPVTYPDEDAARAAAPEYVQQLLLTDVREVPRW